MSSQYSFRPSALEKTKLITLEEAKLVVIQEGKSDMFIPYNEISVVNPKFVGSKNYPNMYQTVITLQNREEVVIKNHDYKGILNMEDISALYTPFILSMHLVISKANDKVIFKKGYSPGWYRFFMILFWSMIVLLGLLCIGVTFGGLYLYTLGIGFAIWMLYRQLAKFKKGNKPAIYTVDDVPPNLLPEVD